MLQIISGYFTNDYILAIVILVLSVGVAKIAALISRAIVHRVVKATKTKVDDLILEKTEKPFILLIVLGGIYWSLSIIDVNSFEVLMSIAVLFISYITASVITILMNDWGKKIARKTRSDLDDSMLPFFRNVVRVFVYAVGFIVILDLWEVDIAPFVASLGIAGIVIGLALQDTLSNVFGGLSMITDKTFKLGDKIKLEDGTVGIVHDIGLRSTRIRTYDNEILAIPNGKLAKVSIQNYTRPDKTIRVVVPFSVAYGTDVENVKKVVLNAINRLGDLMDEPKPSVLFMEMSDFSLNFKAFFWVEDYTNQWGKKLQATQSIYEALNKAKINIPFPTQTVYVKE